MTSKLVVNNIESDVGVSTVTFADNIQIVSGSEYLTITHQGIDFQNTGVGSSTTATSHLLDDYEEGTWTPTFSGQTTAGSYTFTTFATYTKVGNLVTVSASLTDITTVSAGTGDIFIGGLPFAASNSRCVGSIVMSEFNVLNTTVSLSVKTTASTNLKVEETPDGAATSQVSVANKQTNSSFIYLTITYQV